MFKKGQAAMEFLMTYGWAILVVLAAIGALAYFGVLSPSKFLPERTIFQAPLPNTDTAVVSLNGNSVAVAFKNNVGQDIQVNVSTGAAAGGNVTVSDDCQDVTIFAGTLGVNGLAANIIEEDGTNTASGAGAISNTIRNGESFTFIWTCATNSPLEDGTLAVGDKFTAENLGFQYVNLGLGLVRQQSGSVDGKVTQ